MKKSLLFAVMAVVTLAASARVYSVDESKTPRKMEAVTTTEVNVNNIKKAPAAPANVATGAYLSAMYTDGYDSQQAGESLWEVHTVWQASVEEAERGYAVTGFMGDQPVNATYADGVLSIAPGQVSYISEYYGNCAVFLLENATQFNRTKNLEFEINENGVFVLRNGFGAVLLVLEVEYANSAMDICKGGALVPANGTSIDSICGANCQPYAAMPCDTLNTNVEFTYDERGNIDGGVLTGILGFGFVDFAIDGNNVKLDCAPIYYLGGTFMTGCVTKAYNNDGAFDVIKGEGPDGTIDLEKGEMILGMWGVGFEYSTSPGKYWWFANTRMSKSLITFPPVSPSAVNDVNTDKTIKSVEYVNLNGQISSRAFEGINIVVTNYTDGTRTATKVVK